MKIIAIASPAGGVGKTTLAHAISVAAAERASGRLRIRRGVISPYL
jgi:cellulose biosynthesis protein BcsQ